VPRGGNVQHEHGCVLESRGRQRDELQRRQRVHAERQLPERDVYRIESRHVHGQRSVPRRGDVQHEHGRVFEPDGGEWSDLQRWQCVYAKRQLPERHVHGIESVRLHRE
jgi:hypothetical protein